MRVFTDKRYGSIWHPTLFDRTFEDACVHQKNSLQPFSYLYANQPGCPIAAGVSKTIFIYLKNVLIKNFQDWMEMEYDSHWIWWEIIAGHT